MNELAKAWGRRRARQMRDVGISVAAALSGKIKEIKAPDEPDPNQEQRPSEGWDNEIWWDSSAGDAI